MPLALGAGATTWPWSSAASIRHATAASTASVIAVAACSSATLHWLASQRRPTSAWAGPGGREILDRRASIKPSERLAHRRPTVPAREMVDEPLHLGGCDPRLLHRPPPALRPRRRQTGHTYLRSPVQDRGAASLAAQVFGATQELYRATGILNQPRQDLLQLHPGQAQRLGHGQDRLPVTERQVDWERPAVSLACGVVEPPSRCTAAARISVASWALVM